MRYALCEKCLLVWRWELNFTTFKYHFLGHDGKEFVISSFTIPLCPECGDRLVAVGELPKTKPPAPISVCTGEKGKSTSQQKRLRNWREAK